MKEGNTHFRTILVRLSICVVASLVLCIGLAPAAQGIEVITRDSAEVVNQPPMIEKIGDQSVREEEELVFTVVATDRESIPVLTVDDLPEGARFTDHGDGTGLFVWTPEWDAFSEHIGSHVVTFAATDDSGAVAFEEITIEVHGGRDKGWDFAVMVGGSAPQGSFSRYVDGGLGVTVRAVYHTEPAPMIGFWGDINYLWFSSDCSVISYDEPGYWHTAEQEISEQDISLHIGAQLGSNSRRAFFRPRAALGPGLYVFYTSNTITATSWLGEEEEFSAIEEAYVRFGWRIVLGADLFVKPRLGASMELVYDHIYKLDHPEGLHAPRLTTRFNGLFFGMTFAR